jgi:hypothetical protein
MDTARIKSFAPTMDVHAATDPHAGRRSDAEIVVPKIAALAALDTLLTRADSDPHARMPAHPPPQSALVVDLITPAIAANAARLLAQVGAATTDYTHLDPHKPEPERLRAEAAAQSAAEIIEEALKPPPAPATHATDRLLSEPLRVSPDVRPDLHPHGIATAAHAAHAAAPAKVTSPLDHARDTERLAGFGIRPDAPLGMPPMRLAKLLLAAAVAGALIVLLF